MRWFYCICEAVAFIHQRGVIHRDIKLSNVFLTEDEVRLGDFGLCTRFVEDRTLTYVGTEFYMPPEAILGRNMF